MIIKQYTPKIRFKGFSEDWSNLQFFETLDSIIDFRGRTPKKIGLEWSKKGYVALSALNVKNGYIDFSLDNHFGDEELYQKWMGGKELVAGQVLFTTEAPMGNVAQVPDNQGYILSQRTIAFNVKSSVIKNDFLAVLLKSPATFNRLESMTSGGTAKGVSQKSMAKLEVDIPSNLQEQTVIGNLFQNVDQTISLQRRKHKQMQTLKQSLLAKMFPQVGKTEPDIRLKGFSDNWVEVKIGDIFTVTRGHVLSATKLSVKRSCVNSYPVYSSQTKNNGCMGYYNDYLFDTAVTWTTDGANAGTVNFREGKFYSTNVNGVLLSNEGYANQAIAEILNRIAYKHVSKVGNPKLMNNVMAQITINIPSSFEEQNEISQIFKQLDDTLALQAKQLKTLDHLKKALLAKMFV